MKWYSNLSIHIKSYTPLPCGPAILLLSVCYGLNCFPPEISNIEILIPRTSAFDFTALGNLVVADVIN